MKCLRTRRGPGVPCIHRDGHHRTVPKVRPGHSQVVDLDITPSDFRNIRGLFFPRTLFIRGIRNEVLALI